MNIVCHIVQPRDGYGLRIEEFIENDSTGCLKKVSVFDVFIPFKL